ncbi:MAG: dihydroorotate dehydrogenase-like protein [Pseudomonadales bacterium]|nr:dihydroorotate dehydrogenase-like protein [Pseudomonadales bacterium]
MVDITSEYLGIKLKNPLIASSSPLTGSLDKARELEDAGAAAIVLPSLFEEELIEDQEIMHGTLDFQAIGFGEADSFLPEIQLYQSHLDQYLEKAQAIKSSLDIPVIGSLNGRSLSGWLENAKLLEELNCDALELNTYHVSANIDDTAAEVESEYTLLVNELRSAVNVPITVKLSPQYSSLGNYIQQLQHNGANGVVLFNRFYQPDINLDTLRLEPRLQLSTPTEALERIRWIALLSKRIDLSFAATGGFHNASDVLKVLLAGGDAVYLCSVLLQRGPNHIKTLLSEMQAWLLEKEYESITQLKGSLCYEHSDDAITYERGNYLSVLRSYIAETE